VGLEQITPIYIILQCMLERTDAITNESLEPITFVLAYPTIFYIHNRSVLYILRVLSLLNPVGITDTRFVYPRFLPATEENI